jgi:hypothetical protein
MTRWRRNMAVEARAALILAYEPSARAYTAHFERQMRGGQLRRLLFTSHLRFARAGMVRRQGFRWLVRRPRTQAAGS